MIHNQKRICLFVCLFSLLHGDYFERRIGVCKRSSLSADTIGILPAL